MHNSLIEQRRRETKRFLKMRERVWRWEETRKGGVGVQFTPQNERGMGKKVQYALCSRRIIYIQLL